MTEIVALVSPFLVMLRKVPYWLDNVLEQIEPFNPYRKVEAETMAWGYGLKTDVVEGRGIVLRDIDAGEYLLHERSRRGARPLHRVHLRRLPVGLVENGALAAAGIIPHPCRWGPCSN